ncbi:G-protein coupled receptor 37-like 1 [Etheostoma cragini]|uniref:G-protein coupled receptor 37-like 1 n=1 Tax=Etheostoma cragini TaxID=417921 RepID=UPI00155E4CB8|nr:G-protein coupled receptor 37-like 1 [Etheostoma cragini]
MSPCVSVCFCVVLLLPTDAAGVGRAAGTAEPSPLAKNLDPVWIPKRLGAGDAPLPEMLDLDLESLPRRRLARGGGADDDEQQSTFGQSFENDSVTTPRATEFSNGTEVGAADRGDGEDVGGNASPGLFNPFYPLEEGSYAAYAVLFLGGLVLAVGVVGNMALMCIVWNNYYMRSAWNYLLASVAFWDFLVLVLCLPVVVLNQLSHRRILGDITCRMVPYMEVGGATETAPQ